MHSNDDSAVGHFGIDSHVPEDSERAEVTLRLFDELTIVGIADVDQQLTADDVFARFDVERVGDPVGPLPGFDRVEDGFALKDDRPDART